MNKPKMEYNDGQVTQGKDLLATINTEGVLTLTQDGLQKSGPIKIMLKKFGVEITDTIKPKKEPKTVTASSSEPATVVNVLVAPVELAAPVSECPRGCLEMGNKDPAVMEWREANDPTFKGSKSEVFWNGRKEQLRETKQKITEGRYYE